MADEVGRDGQMTGQLAHDVLRRMASPPPPAPDDVPITSSKAVRLAITRAADKTHSMEIGVSSLQEEVVTLDSLLGVLDPELMLLSMVSGGRIQGIAAVGLELRAALLELQTIGRVMDMAAEPRTPTETDARLSEPLITAFLAHLNITAAQSALAGWGDGFAVGEKLSSARAAGLILDDVRFRVIRVSLDLGAGDRNAELTIALPNTAEIAKSVVKPEVTGDWQTRFQTVVNGSPAKLNALLHQFKLPLHQVENLVVGQVIPLPGCTVSSVKLMASDGRRVATARLGQSSGMRAVRVEAAPHLQMDDMDHLGAAPDMGQLPAMDGMDAMADPMGGEMSFAPDEETDQAMDMDAMDMAAIDISTDEAEAAPLSWDEETPDGEPAQPLSWDDEDLSAEPNTGEAAALDWSNEDFEPPQT